MKTLKNMKFAVIFATIAYTAGSMGMSGFLGGLDVSNQIDINGILNQASALGAQIPSNLDLNAIKAAVEVNLHNIPHSLLGVNLRAIDASNIDYLKMAINQAKLKLPMLIILLQFPVDKLIQIFEGIILPKLQVALAKDPAGQSILNVLKSGINLAKANPAAIAAISSRIAQLLSDINTGIQNLDLSNINPTVLASAINYMLNKYEATYTTAYPIISSFITNNKDAIQNLVAQIKAMNLNYNTQQLIESAKGAASNFGL